MLAILLAAVGLQGSASSAAPCSGFGVTEISPAVGFVTGGTSATITGCGFSGAGTLTVKFGTGSPVTVTPASDTSLTATSPVAAAPGDVTVEVRLHPSSGPDSTGTTTFTYVAKPAITKIAPASGPEAGGTSVHVTGSALTQTGATIAVKFGTTAAASVSDVSATSLKAMSPAGTGTKDVTVTVTLPGGESATSNGKPFEYVPAPTVTSVSPTSGPVTGGTDVTVTGTHFQPGAQVLFGPSDGTPSLTGDSNGTPVSVLSSTSILVTAPAGIVGATNVVVLNPDGQTGALESGSAHPYTYTGTAPSITSVSPATGSSLGGTTVTITGAGFLANANVAFAGSGDQVPLPAGTSVVVASDGTQITAKTPAHAAGIVDVVVTNPGGGKATKTDAFTFSAAPAPTITALTVAMGTSLGGTQLTISGTNFSAGTTVSFGGTAAASAAALNATTITARTPAHAAGAVDVKVTLPDGQSDTLPSAFTFNAAAPPTITSVTPSTGKSGTEITIAGSGFADPSDAASPAASPAIVSVGSAECVPVSLVPGQTSLPDTTCLQPVSPHPIVRSPTSIVGLVPNAPGGTKTVTVKNPDGQTATSTFTNTGPAGAPTLTSISPATANTLGNTVVHLTGTDFARGARVTFGRGGNGGSGTATSVSSDGTTIDARAPAGVYGTVDVTVVNPDPDHNPSTLSATLEDGFVFTAAPRPTITAITPSSGPGGTEVTITGTGFANTCGASTNAVAPAAVTIGREQLLQLAPRNTDCPTQPPPAPARPPVVLNSTTITGLIPTAPAGTVHVAVMNPDGQGAILVDGYTYPPDTTAPTTTAAATVGGVPYTFGDWAKGSVAIALTATDDTSGVRDISFSSTGAQTNPVTVVPGASRSVTVTAQGKTTISYFASDNANNVESANTRQVWIDSIVPSVTTTATIPSGGGTTPYIPGTNTGQDVTVTFDCTDGNSGVATLTYTSGSTTTSSGTNPLRVTVTSSGNDQSVTGTCTDAAGNKTTSTFDRINITKTSPSIHVAATIAGGAPYTAGVWVRRTVTVTFTCTPISADNQIVSVTAPVQVQGPTENRTVSGTCTDQAGNSSTVTFGTPTAGIDIDRTLPVATATATTTNNSGATVPYTAGSWTNHDVVVTFHCTDNGANQSGVASIDPPVTVSAAGTTNGVIGNCTDVAGNHANPPAFFGPIKIDKTAPACTVAVIPNPLSGGNNKLVNVTATVFVTDGSSGPNGSVLESITSNNPATAGSDIVGFTVGTASYTGQLRATKGRMYTLTYQAFDVARNASQPCSIVVRAR
ncbi:MAG TPA: IPT/TIG domain-containing protein [Gaiellaceae bacterium]